MPTATDTRIIEMRFENREFEKNIAKSQKSIEDLKEAMDFEETSKGMAKFSEGMKALDFSGMANNIQKLADKFTGLGTASEYVLSRIRAGLESAAYQMEAFIRSISIGQIGYGEAKYDSLTKAVQTIVAGGKNTEEDAYRVMERVMVYTDQTSHSFQTMVGQISTLTSKGMGLEQAERLVEAIGNASTKAGGSAEQAAMAMGVLSKVIGGTHLGYEQFLQLSNTARVITREWREQAIAAGLAVGNLVKKGEKIYTAPKFGTAVEVTADNLETTLQKRWLTGKVLQEQYKNYQFGDTIEELKHPEEALDSFGKTAYLTGQRALSLTDAINSWKESVSSGWMTTFRILFGDLSESMEHFTGLADRVLDILERFKEWRNGILQAWATAGGRESLWKIFLGDYESDIETGAWGIFDTIDRMVDILRNAFWDFAKMFAPEDIVANWDDPGEKEAWLGNRLANMTARIEEFIQKVHNFFEEPIDDGKGGMTSRFEQIREVVQGVLGVAKIAWDILSGLFSFALEIVHQLQPSFDSITEFLAKLGVQLYEVGDSEENTDGIAQFFAELGEKIKPLTGSINEFTAAVTGLLTKIIEWGAKSEIIGQALTFIHGLLLGALDIVNKLATPVVDFVTAVIDAVTILFENDFSPEGFAQAGAKLGAGFRTLFNAALDAIFGEESIVGNAIRDLFGLWEDETKNDSDSFFTAVRKTITGFFGNVGTFVSSLFGGFDLVTALESGFGFGAAFNFIGNVIGWFKNINLYNLIMAFLGAATLFSLFNLIRNARKAVRTIGGFFEDFGSNLNLKNIKQGVFSEYEWFSERFINIAKAIALLAASVFILGGMNRESLIQGVLALVAIAGVFALLTVALRKLKDTKLNQMAIISLVMGIATSIAIIAAALSVLSLALIPLASSPEKMISAVLGMAAMLSVMGLFFVIMMKTMDKFTFGLGGTNQWAGIGKMALMLLSLSISVGILAAALSALAVALTPLALVGWSGTLAAVVGLGLILTELGIFIKLMLVSMDDFAFGLGGGKTTVGSILKSGLMLVVVSSAITLLAVGLTALMGALVPLSLMGWDGMIRAVTGLGAVLVELGLFMKFMTGLPGDSATSSIKIAGLAGFAASLGILVMAITPFAVMSWGGYARAMAGLAGILAQLLLFIFIIQKMPLNDDVGLTVKIAGLAGFALSLGILVLALTPFALMDWGSWARGIAGLAVVLGLLLGSIAILSNSKMLLAKDVLGPFIGFSVSMAILIGSLAIFASMDWGGWARGIAGLAAVLVLLIGTMFLLSQNKVPIGVGVLGPFIGFALSVTVLMFSLTALANMSWPQILNSLQALGIVLALMVGTIVILSNIESGIKGGFQALLMMGGIAILMLTLSSSLSHIKDVPWPLVSAFTVGLASLIVAMAAALSVMQNVGIGGALKGILILSAGIIALSAALSIAIPMLMGALGSSLSEFASRMAIVGDMLSLFSERMGSIDEGGMDHAIKMVQNLASLIGPMIAIRFSASSVAAFSDAVSRLTLIAGKLVIFSNKLSSLSNDGGVGKAREIVSGIRSLFENELSGFTGFVGTGVLFSTAMFNLGTGLETFNNHTSNIGEGAGGSALQLIKDLSGCAKDLDIIYKMNIDTLSSKLSGLGGAIMLYAKGAKEATGMEVDETTDVSGAVTLLQKISTSLADEGGFTIPENMPDTDSIGLFGAQLAALAAALVDFEAAGNGLGDGTKQALDTLDFFHDLKTKLIDTEFSSNLSSTINAFGEGDASIQVDELTQFGANIEQLGLALNQFAGSTQVVDKETGEMKPIDYSMATDALQSIVDMSEKLPSIGGAIQIITGRKTDLGTLAGQLEDLGVALGDFHTNTTTFNEKNKTVEAMDYSNTIAFLNSIGDLETKLPTVGGIKSWWEGNKQKLSDLGVDMQQFGSGLRTFTDQLNGKSDDPNSKPFSEELATQATNTVDHMITFIQKMNEKLPTVGGLVNIWNTIFTGRDMTLSDLGTQIGGLATGLGTLGSELNRGNWNEGTGAEYAISALDSMMDIMIKLSELNTISAGSSYGVALSMSEFINSLVGNVAELADASENSTMVQNILKLMFSISDEFEQWGEIKPERIETFARMAEALAAITSIDITKDWSVVGGNIASGVTEGIKSGTSGVIQAAVDMALAAYEAAKKALDSNSPSRLFMDLGGFLSEGLAIGIEKKSDEAGNAAEEMANVTLDEAAGVLGLISRLMAEGVETNPTITPVLDMSLAEAEMQRFRDNNLNGGTIPLSGETSIGIAGSLGNEKETVNGNGGISLDGIYSRMEQLGNQIVTMGNQIRQMKIVLDSGALVGGVSDSMDADFGRKQFYAGRRN